VVTLLRNKTELQFALPTEAQWEYACRAGHSGNLYNDGSAFGDNSAARAGRGYAPLGWGQANSGWVSNTSVNDHWQPVALLKPSDWDFYDFYGNVLEWCRDWYGTYSADDQTDPPGAASGTLRVGRGGSYALDSSALNSYYRRHNNTTSKPDVSDNNTGYRLVVETDEGDSAVAATGADRGSADSANGYLETRPASTLAGIRSNSGESFIDTATPLSFVMTIR
jgi:formylglycine-generating enzyme required for sulfatase activity